MAQTPGSAAPRHCPDTCTMLCDRLKRRIALCACSIGGGAILALAGRIPVLMSVISPLTILLPFGLAITTGLAKTTTA